MAPGAAHAPPPAPPSDAELLALCVWDEARGEIPDGRAAVARVVLNRMKARFESDGTVAGTVLAWHQFSGFWFDMVGGKYRPVAFSRAEAAARARALLLEAKRGPLPWSLCQDVAARVQAGTWSSELYDQLGDEALNYANLDYCDPIWATPDKFIVKIGHHSFFRA